MAVSRSREAESGQEPSEQAAANSPAVDKTQGDTL